MNLIFIHIILHYNTAMSSTTTYSYDGVTLLNVLYFNIRGCFFGQPAKTLWGTLN